MNDICVSMFVSFTAKCRQFCRGMLTRDCWSRLYYSNSQKEQEEREFSIVLLQTYDPKYTYEFFSQSFTLTCKVLICVALKFAVCFDC